MNTIVQTLSLIISITRGISHSECFETDIHLLRLTYEGKTYDVEIVVLEELYIYDIEAIRMSEMSQITRILNIFSKEITDYLKN